MDFQTLFRKDLQTLCKKNKIPANMTNVAMADALQALQHVEGIEELMNHSDSNAPESPERLAIGTPGVPLTKGRTATRRKVSKENKNVNVNETSAVASSRRRAPATASRKLETHMKDDEEYVAKTPAPSVASVQRVYSTRRSVRLLEKNMADLTLKEKAATEPVKMDDISKEVVNNMDEEEEKKDMHGSHEEATLKECLEESKESNLEDDDQVTNMGDNNVAPNLDAASVFDEIHDKRCDEPNALFCQTSAMSTDNDEETDQQGLDDVPPAEFTSEVEKPNEVSEMEEDTSFSPKVSDDVSAEKSFETNLNVPEDGDHETKALKSQSTIGEELDDGKESDQAITNSTATDSSLKKYYTAALVDIEVVESEEFSMTIRERHQSISPKDPVPKIQEYIDSETLVDVAVLPEVVLALPTIGFPPSLGKISTPVKTTTPQRFLVSKTEARGEFQNSPLANDNSLLHQTLSASRNSNRKQPTIENLTLISETDNENIDNSGMKVAPKKDEAKKNEIILDEKSLRQLRKLLKKRQMANNKRITEDNKNVTEEQVGKMRQPLATLPKNCLAAGETENEN